MPDRGILVGACNAMFHWSKVLHLGGFTQTDRPLADGQPNDQVWEYCGPDTFDQIILRFTPNGGITAIVTESFDGPREVTIFDFIRIYLCDNDVTACLEVVVEAFAFNLDVNIQIVRKEDCSATPRRKLVDRIFQGLDLGVYY
jgi:hypothetical protein